MVDQGVVDAFQLMWGPFPEPVLLVHESRTILAVNDSARAGGVPVGVKCSSLNPETKGDSHCKQCRAFEALRSGEAMSRSSVVGGRLMKGYWMPLKGVEGVYVHFGIPIGDEVDSTQAVRNA